MHFQRFAPGARVGHTPRVAAASRCLSADGRVTTKSEPSAFAADSAVASEPVAPAEAAPLPSIIVDPQALAPPSAEEPVSEQPGPSEPGPSTVAAKADVQPAAPDGSASPTPEPTPSTATAASPAPANGSDGDTDALRLSDLEAERYATSYRASWEPGEALDAPLPVALAPAAGPVSGAAATTTVGAAVAEPIVLPGNARMRGVALTGLAVLAFGALLALALSSTGDPSAPPRAAEAPPAPRATPEPRVAPAPTDLATQPQAPAPAPIEPAAVVAAPGATAGAAAAPVVAEAPLIAPPEPPTAPEPVAVAPAAPPATPVATVRVQIATSPADAELTIDGVAVSNPYEALVPKGSEKHRVTASAAGHESRDQLVGYERKRDLLLRLKKLPAPRPAPIEVAIPTRPAPAPVAQPSPRPARTAPVRTAKKQAASPEPPRKGAAFVSESPY